MLMTTNKIIGSQVDEMQSGQFSGITHTNTDGSSTIALNDTNIETNGEFRQTADHEMGHALLNQGALETSGDEHDYIDLVGSYGDVSSNFFIGTSAESDAGTNNHVGNKANQSIFEMNNAKYDGWVKDDAGSLDYQMTSTATQGLLESNSNNPVLRLTQALAKNDKNAVFNQMRGMTPQGIATSFDLLKDLNPSTLATTLADTLDSHSPLMDGLIDGTSTLWNKVPEIASEVGTAVVGGLNGMHDLMTVDTADKPMLQMLLLKTKASSSDYGFARSPTKLLQFVNPVNVYNQVDRIEKVIHDEN